MSNSDDLKRMFTEEEAANARTMMLALEPFRQLRATIPLQYVYTFLQVVADEGQGPTKYAEEAGTSVTVMTRHLLDIGARNRQHEEGFGLVTQQRDRVDLRRTHAVGTPEGKKVIRQVMNALKTLPKGS
jgi:hypothetical protein